MGGGPLLATDGHHRRARCALFSSAHASCASQRPTTPHLLSASCGMRQSDAAIDPATSFARLMEDAALISPAANTYTHTRTRVDGLDDDLEWNVTLASLAKLGFDESDRDRNRPSRHPRWATAPQPSPLPRALRVCTGKRRHGCSASITRRSQAPAPVHSGRGSMYRINQQAAVRGCACPRSASMRSSLNG